MIATKGIGYSTSAPTEGQLLIAANGTRFDGSHPGVICFHGHGGDSLQYLPNASPSLTGPGYHAWRLAEAGYIVLAIDDAGGVAWSGPPAMSRADDAYAKLTAPVASGGYGAKAGVIGLVGWSMGGLTVLNWMKRNTTKVAATWLWAPVTDLDWAEAQAAWKTEIDTAFSPYSTASVGYRVHDEYPSWRLGIPIEVAHAADDTTVPQSQSQAFVTGVNDPAVTFRSIASGGHIGLFGSVTDREFIAQFRQALT